MNAQVEVSCSSCIHAIPFAYPHNLKIAEGLSRCARSVMILNVFTGEGQHRFCAQERHHGDCGPEGRRFEAVKQLTTERV